MTNVFPLRGLSSRGFALLAALCATPALVACASLSAADRVRCR